MKALVTGGAGFIGAATARALSDTGWETHVLARPGTPLDRVEGLAVTLHRVDLLDTESLQRLMEALQPEYIVNAAANAGHPASGEETMQAWKDNTLSLVSLLQALRGAMPRKIVHLGSSLEYAPADRPHRESDPCRPETARGATKLAASVALDEWAHETGVPYANLRIFSVYGRGEPTRRVVPQLLRSLREDIPFRPPSVSSRRDFVDVTDVVRAIMLAMADASSNGVVNVGTGIETSVEELISLAEDVSGLRLRYAPEPYPARPADRAHSSADTSKARTELGWEPTVTLAAGLAELWTTS